jgi:hypothetical protein
MNQEKQIRLTSINLEELLKGTGLEKLFAEMNPESRKKLSDLVLKLQAAILGSVDIWVKRMELTVDGDAKDNGNQQKGPIESSARPDEKRGFIASRSEPKQSTRSPRSDYRAFHSGQRAVAAT